MKPKSKKAPATKKETVNNNQSLFEEIKIQEGEIVEITPDMIIGDVILAYPETLPVLKEMGIHCIGCYASTFESIQEGTSSHGLNPLKVCTLLNKKIHQTRLK